MRLIDADAIKYEHHERIGMGIDYGVNENSYYDIAYKTQIDKMPTIEPEDKCCECDAWNKYKNYSQHWISVMDRLPEMDDRVLVYTTGHEYHVWDAMPNRGENYAWEDEEGLYHNLYEAYLWFPFPEPYEEQV